MAVDLSDCAPNILVSLNIFCGLLLTTSCRRFNISSYLTSLILNIDNIHIRAAQTCCGLKGALLPNFARCHVSVQRASYSTAIAAAVFTVVSIHAGSFSGFSVSSLDFLIYEVLKVLLPYLSFLKFNFVSNDMLF